MSFSNAFRAAAVIGIAVAANSACSSPALPASSSPNDLFLRDGWRIQSAAQSPRDGAAISSPTFDTAAWRETTVPSTVLATLVKDGVYTNIFLGTNFAAIPTAPFSNAWWFRDEFNISPAQASQNADLIFEGVNYRANIWLNGRQLAATNQAFGSFRIFHLDTTGLLQPGKNTVALEIFPPKPGDYTMGFVDWNPKAPDHEMGLWRPVKLHFSQDVTLQNVFVQTALDHATWQTARLTISAELANHTSAPIETTLQGRLADAAFSQKFTLAPHQSRPVQLTPENNPALNLQNPQLWWPWELGEPHLYNLQLTAATPGSPSADAQNIRFGIREVADYLTPEGYRGYTVNGKKILIRGGGWADEILLRENRANLQAQLQYVKAMNLNAIRLEGVWGSSQQLYDLADEDGLLVMPGWSCQWEWEDGLGKKTDDFGAFQTPAEMTLATNYLHDQVTWLRNHPSIFVWVLGSDKHPRPELESRYNTLLPAIDPTRPALMSCAGIKSSLTGPSAVKMNGPYDYVTPNYWYLDQKNGGAFGYNTETGPGPQPPPLDTLERMLPPSHLWPIDKTWDYHCARGQFKDMKRYLEAYNHRYGPAASVSEFAYKSQAANYEALRAMYEAFAVNLPRSTGIIQWMLNASWPKLYWQLYDYYLVPGGAFYAVQHGAAPFALIYNYGDHAIYLVNQTPRDIPQAQITISAYDLNSKKILNQTLTSPAPTRAPRKIFDLSTLQSPTPVYFLDLHATAPGVQTADNFYWLSTKPDLLDEAKTTWYVTPDKSYADFTPLNKMPPAHIQTRLQFHPADHTNPDAPETQTAEITLTNPTDTLAFFLELQIHGGPEHHILTPVLWDDNYISLPPHTTRTLHARFPAAQNPQLQLQGWNIPATTITE